jgi:hypothetical protein
VSEMVWHDGYPPRFIEVGRFRRWGQRKMEERALCLQHERHERVASWRWAVQNGIYPPANDTEPWSILVVATTTTGCKAVYLHRGVGRNASIKLLWYDGNDWVLADKHGPDIARRNMDDR